MDLSRLSRGDQVIGVSGIALFVFSFFKWLGVEYDPVPGAEASKSAWSFTLTLFAVLIGIAMTVFVILKATDVKLPEKVGNFTWGQVMLVAGVVAFVFVLIKLITGWGDLPDGYDSTRKIGIFLGTIASAGLAAGGYLKFQEDKAGAGGSATPPPPPPTA